MAISGPQTVLLTPTFHRSPSVASSRFFLGSYAAAARLSGFRQANTRPKDLPVKSPKNAKYGQEKAAWLFISHAAFQLLFS